MVQQVSTAPVVQTGGTQQSAASKGTKETGSVFQSMIQAKTDEAVKSGKAGTAKTVKKDGDPVDAGKEDAQSGVDRQGANLMQLAQAAGAGIALQILPQQAQNLSIPVVENGQNGQAIQPGVAGIGPNQASAVPVLQIGGDQVLSSGAAAAQTLQQGQNTAGLQQNISTAARQFQAAGEAVGTVPGVPNAPKAPEAPDAAGLTGENTGLRKAPAAQASGGAAVSVQAAEAESTLAANQLEKPAAQSQNGAQVQTADSKAGAAVSPLNAGSANQTDAPKPDTGFMQQGSQGDTHTAKENSPEANTAQNTFTASGLYGNGNVVIKVSDASSKVTQSACRQVSDQVVLNYKKGNPEFVMELYPKDLGKVSVKVSMESGTLTVAVMASNPKTQSMLLANSDQIQSMLQNSVNHPVQVVEQAQGKQWYEQAQDQSGQSQAQQQQQQEQEQENSRHRSAIYQTDDGEDDFLTVMQQLRIKKYEA